MNWSRLIDNIFFPLVYLLNRAFFDRFNRMVFMFAYRINGMGIAWHCANGLTLSENRFLRCNADKIDDGTVFDIGANVGDYALVVRANCPNARIICFEPQPKTFKRLERNCVDANVELEQLGLSNRICTTSLYELAGRDSSPVASLTAETLRIHGTVGESFEISLDTIDNYCECNGIKSIRLLKIDTEGHDLDVLHGASIMLLRGQVDLVEFEIIPANIYTDVHFCEFVDALKGYNLYRLCLNGTLVPLLPYDWRFTELYMTYNVIAVRDGFVFTRG